MPDIDTADSLLQRLRILREQHLHLLALFHDQETHTQSHPELSPPAWHVGHARFVETYWLQDQIAGEDSLTADWHDLYFPEQAPKTTRGVRMPAIHEFTAWVTALDGANDAYWLKLLSANSDHPLMRDFYVLRFLIQHYCQHLENLMMCLQQAGHRVSYPPAMSETAHTLSFPHCTVSIGANCKTIDAYDNEYTAHTVALESFAISSHPVSVGQWQHFIDDGGYCKPDLWPVEGWQWRSRVEVDQPDYWHAQKPAAPVLGISWYEAQAFARWTGARLPHEYEWEHAARSGKLRHLYQCWEWCANTLVPYPGFKAFPYTGYSQDWFDDHLPVLRGGSLHTQHEIRRHSFRNYYPPAHRHIFAGLRLAWSV